MHHPGANPFGKIRATSNFIFRKRRMTPFQTNCDIGRCKCRATKKLSHSVRQYRHSVVEF